MLSAIPDANAGTQKSYDYYRCRVCGTTRIASLLSAQELERIYPADFYSYVPQVSSNKIFSALNLWVYDRHRFRPQFERMLEIGSGRGDFIARTGWQDRAVGLERSQAAHVAGKDIGVNVVVGDVEDSDLFSEACFDYVYANHAFEHLNDPDAALRSVHKWLKPQGRIFLGLPNISSLAARLFGRYWYHFAAPLHVALYTPRGIRLMLERSGFEVERIAYNSDPLSVPMSCFIAAGRYPAHMRRWEKTARASPFGSGTPGLEGAGPHGPWGLHRSAREANVAASHVFTSSPCPVGSANTSVPKLLASSSIARF